MTLPEELLLLTLDEHGTAHGAPATNLELGLLAAAVLELQLRGRLEITPESLKVTDGSPTGERVLDEVLELLIALDPAANLAVFFSGTAGRLGWLRERVLGALAEKGIVRHEEGRVLWLIPQHRYSVEHGAAELSLIERLLRVLALGEPCDRRTCALLTIVAACFTSDAPLRERLFAGMRDNMYEVVNSGGEAAAVTRDALSLALAATAPPVLPTLLGSAP